VGEKVHDAVRATIPLGDKLLNTGATNRDERELGCNEKAVCQDKENDGNES
jgi:hypothetical protein